MPQAVFDRASAGPARVEAIPKALARARLSLAGVDLLEINKVPGSLDCQG